MTVITAAIEADGTLLALTQAEKWQALRELGNGFAGEQAFILLCGAALFVLTALLIAVSYNRRKKDRRTTSELFNAYADERGLSGRERQILLEIATRAKLKRNESIFTLADAFNRGAAKAAEDALASQGERRGRHLGAELALLRKKLGFEKRISDLPGSGMKSDKPGSLQIPVGKKLQIIPHDSHESDGIEATVIKNDEIELAVKLAAPLEADPGSLCRVQYYFRGSVWEFNASVISCHGGILVLTHSYDVRFVNRRRFLRVPVSKPGFIASFPFARTFPASSNDAEWTKHDSTGVLPVAWGPPEFVPGVVTELAGPGLRIEAPLEVNVGDRVAVVIKVSEEPASRRQDASTQSAPAQKSKRTGSKVVEAIGEVRHVKAVENGFSMAVELTGLSDSNVNELVRETNSASFELGAKDSDAQVSTGSETNGKSEIVEQMVVQGV